MTQDVPEAQHAKMDARSALAEEFFQVTGAEMIPFVSDEATWYDFDYLDIGELTAAVKSFYGVALVPAQLDVPFWALLDFLDDNRTQKPR